MRRYHGRERRRILRLITLAVYALAVGWASVAHAEVEVPRSSPVLESEHTEQCPTLHDDAVCGSSFHAKLSAPTPGVWATTDAAAPGRDHETSPPAGTTTSTTLARAPPSR